MKQSYDWQFPLPRTHTGILQGNGVMGVMIWGERNVLRVTFNRGDFWDHRGGYDWQPQMNFADIRRLLEANDEAGLRAIFAVPRHAGEPVNPTLLPLGRIELHFAPEVTLATGTLDLATGRVSVTLHDGKGATHVVAFDLNMVDPLLAIELPKGLAMPCVERITAWSYPKVAERLRENSIKEPATFDEQDGALSGWVQERPAAGDAPLCAAWRTDAASRTLFLTTLYGDDVAAAKENAKRALETATDKGLDALRTSAVAWWADYWKHVPRVDVPDANVQFLYHYGMYKFAGLTNPTGIAAGLQGPWIEEYQLPPWSADYHLNINVQMCYQPAYAGNRLQHLDPLFAMIKSWLPKLRENAAQFVGVNDGLMLPHSVDDRCRIIGGFWTGTIDHACTAWVGKMMFDYWSYGGADDAFLRDEVVPFLEGALRVYEAMMDRAADGTLSMPVSVSPEYRAAQMNAWGRNASFQLAAAHALVASLRAAAAHLGLPGKPLWDDIERNLPRACVAPAGRQKHIMLWEGTDLEESHRHHSHLGGITPFDVIDPADPNWRPIVDASINHWIKQGMGLWSGWCMPWAVMLHHRLGNPDMAVLLLTIWQRVFTNEGHGTLHDCNFPGLTLLGVSSKAPGGDNNEVMQMDAGMGVTAAILDGLVHAQAGVLRLFSGAPAAWRDVSFEGVRMPGAFLVSAARRGGNVTEVSVQSERGATLKLRNPWPGRKVTVKAASVVTDVSGEVLEVQTKAGQRITLQEAS